MNLSSLAERLTGETLTISGNPNYEITRISSPENADTQSLCVIWDKKALETLSPDVPIVAPQELFTPSRTGLISTNPRALLPKLLALFSHSQAKPKGIHPSAVVDPSAKISPDAFIGACAFVGEGCSVGEGTVIEPNATLLANVRVGSYCMIHSGAVIGEDGFGF